MKERKLTKYFLIATDIGLKRGGIQVWAYYILQQLQFERLDHKSFSLKSISISSIVSLIGCNFSSRIFILMDWKKMAFAVISFFLSKLKLRKSRFIVLVQGDEILNLSRFRKWIIRVLIHDDNVFFISNTLRDYKA